MSDLAASVIGTKVPGPQLTRDEKMWGISHKAMGWLIDGVKHTDKKIKSSLRNGETLLHVCARCIDGEEVCEILVRSGYNINAVDVDGQTAIYKAIGAGNYEVCEILLGLGANVNHQDNCLNTPVHKAIAENNLDIIKLLLSYGADINKHNMYMESPLKLAAQEERLDICRFIIDNGGGY